MQDTINNNLPFGIDMSTLREVISVINDDLSGRSVDTYTEEYVMKLIHSKHTTVSETKANVHTNVHIIVDNNTMTGTLYTCCDHDIHNKNEVWVSSGVMKGFIIDIEKQDFIGVASDYTHPYRDPTGDELKLFEDYKRRCDIENIPTPEPSIQPTIESFYPSSPSQLTEYQQLLSENFNDEWRKDGCQRCTLAGVKPYMFCSNTPTNGKRVCANCLGKKTGKEVEEKFQNKHYTAVEHRSEMRKKRITFAMNKLGITHEV